MRGFKKKTPSFLHFPSPRACSPVKASRARAPRRSDPSNKHLQLVESRYARELFDFCLSRSTTSGIICTRGEFNLICGSSHMISWILGF